MGKNLLIRNRNSYITTFGALACEDRLSPLALLPVPGSSCLTRIRANYQAQLMNKILFFSKYKISPKWPNPFSPGLDQSMELNLIFSEII